MSWEGWCAHQQSGRPGKVRCAQQCEFCRKRQEKNAGSAVPGLYTSELSSGGFIDLDSPDPAVIRLEDVARGLSHLCRFNGQCRRFYSVAEHACLVAHRLREQGYSPAVVFAGLHHDDGEALLCDVPRPLKKLLPEFKPIEERVFVAVTDALGISHLPFEDPAVKEADDWALQREAFELMPSKGEHWHASLRHPGGPAPWRLGHTPGVARRMWVSWHSALKRMLAADG